VDFKLTEEQLMIQRTAKDFTAREIEPIAVELDRSGRLPPELAQKMAATGFFGMTVPRKYGGQGTGALASALVLEQFGYSGTGAFWLAGFSNSIPEVVHYYGSEAIRSQFLPGMLSGNMQSSILFTEPDTGSDPRLIKTTAVPQGDKYIINGAKRFITFGTWDGYGTLYAKDDTGKITCFMIKKNVPGYSAPKVWELMGGGGIESADVYFDNVAIPAENMVGEKGKGFDILLHWIAGEKLQQCAVNTGIAQAALDESVKYAKSRMLRDKSMSALQGIQWELADMHVKVESSRWMAYRAAFLQEQYAPNWQTDAAAAKLFCIPMSLDVVRQAVTLHGGYGYTKEFKVERLHRAAIGSSVIATSLEINKSIVGGWLVR